MANEKGLVAYPIIEELEYRQQIDSAQLNRMLKSIEESVLRSIMRGTELSEYLNSLSLGVYSSYSALQLQDQSFKRYPDFGVYSGAFATAFDGISGVGRQDVMAGIVTLDWTKEHFFSKIPRVNSQPSVNIEIYLNGVLKDSSDHIYSILDRDHATFWVEQTNIEEHTIELRLPPSTNKKFNYLELVPFPVFGVEITNVRYVDVLGVEQNIYDKNTNQFPFYNNKGPMVFHLSPKVFNNIIKIDFKKIPGLDVIGFTSIDVGLIDYNDNISTFYIPFKNINNAGTITPDDIELDFYIDGNVIANYTSYITGVSIVNSTNGTGDSIPLKVTKEKQDNNLSIDSTNGLWLEVQIKEVDMTTPMFRGCKFVYNKS